MEIAHCRFLQTGGSTVPCLNVVVKETVRQKSKAFGRYKHGGYKHSLNFYNLIVYKHLQATAQQKILVAKDPVGAVCVGHRPVDHSNRSLEELGQSVDC